MDKRDFKETLRILRENIGLTQKEIAIDMKVNPANYSKWENGKFPDYATLVKIAKYHNCSTDYLLGVTEYKNKESIVLTNTYIDEIRLLVEKLPDNQRERTIQIMIGFLSVFNLENLSLKEQTTYFSLILQLIYMTLNIAIISRKINICLEAPTRLDDNDKLLARFFSEISVKQMELVNFVTDESLKILVHSKNKVYGDKSNKLDKQPTNILPLEEMLSNLAMGEDDGK